MFANTSTVYTFKLSHDMQILITGYWDIHLVKNDVISAYYLAF